MHMIFADITISMSEFKKNPASVLRQAGSRPVAVLNHNKAAFYMVEPRLFQAMLDELAGQEARSPTASTTAPAPQDKRPAWRAAMARLEISTALAPSPPSPPDH
jgi:antitoxin StbD